MEPTRADRLDTMDSLKILRGVEKNKGLIAFPFYDVIPWWLYRLHPSANNWWQGKLVDLFRNKIRSRE